VIAGEDRAAIRNAARDMARNYAAFQSALERFQRASKGVPEREIAQAIEEGVGSSTKLSDALGQVFERLTGAAHT
jgi:hypothetical protein